MLPLYFIHTYIYIYICIYMCCITCCRFSNMILSRVGVNWPLSQFLKDLCGGFHAHSDSHLKTCGRFHAHCSKSRRRSLAGHGIVRPYSNALQITTETYKCHYAYHEHRCFYHELLLMRSEYGCFCNEYLCFYNESASRQHKYRCFCSRYCCFCNERPSRQYTCCCVCNSYHCISQ